ncbi:hypothetical protein VMF7928_00654 [Vibrio marisflavi CECT 7928]|uniref:Uncharacterized protein n=1 Tax=Vibrio marisflavi CECT 7928 TaxID=634439 RepID=A0ABM9A064_9VIBR|nr:hypothetical protein VMF7928_00654 [Vibrio marisflavi CECT 7928]
MNGNVSYFQDIANSIYFEERYHDPKAIRIV